METTYVIMSIHVATAPMTQQALIRAEAPLKKGPKVSMKFPGRRLSALPTPTPKSWTPRNPKAKNLRCYYYCYYYYYYYYYCQ